MGLAFIGVHSFYFPTSLTEEALSASKLMEVGRVLCHCHLCLPPPGLVSRALQGCIRIAGEGAIH